MSKRFNKTTIISSVGFILSMGMAFIDIEMNSTLKNILVIGGLVFIYLGFILARMEASFSDNKKTLAWADQLGFDLSVHYNDYKRIMDTKDNYMYSAWKEDLLKSFCRYDDGDSDNKDTDVKKQKITDDIQHYLKDIRRETSERVELFNSILVPAEFGIVASIYELDFEALSGEYKLLVVIMTTIALVLLFAVEINYRNRIIRFVDDFCEVLGIPLND